MTSIGMWAGFKTKRVEPMQYTELLAQANPTPVVQSGKFGWFEVLAIIGGVITTAGTVIVSVIQARANSRLAVVEVELKFAMAEVVSLKQENKELKEKVILMTDSLSKKDLEMLKRDQRISDLETQNKGQADLMDRQNEKILKLQQSEAAALHAEEAALHAEEALRIEVDQLKSKSS